MRQILAKQIKLFLFYFNNKSNNILLKLLYGVFLLPLLIIYSFIEAVYLVFASPYKSFNFFSNKKQDGVYLNSYKRYMDFKQKTRVLSLSSVIIVVTSVIVVNIITSIIFGVGNIQTANAAAITWEGDESTLWSAGGNWSSGSVPGSGDVATFDGTGNTNCVIDSVINVGGIDINSGYTGTITQDASMTVGSSGFAQDDGTFAGGSQDIDLNGVLTLTSGTLTLTSGTISIAGNTVISGGTFSANGGTVLADKQGSAGNQTINLRPGTDALYNLSVDKDVYYLELADETLTVEGTTTLTSGRVSTGTLDLKGDLVIESGYLGGNGTFQFSNSGEQAITNNCSNTLANPISVTAGTVTITGSNLATSAALTVSGGSLDFGSLDYTTSGAVTVSGGTLDFGSGNVDLNYDGNSLSMTSGNLILTSGNTYFYKHFVVSGGTLDANSGTVIADRQNSNQTFNLRPGTDSLYNLTIDKNGYYFEMNSEVLTVEGTAALTDGRSVSGTFDLQGDITVGASFDQNTALWQFTGGNDQTLTLASAGFYDYDMTVNKTGGSLELGSNLTLDATNQDLTIVEGTFDISGYDLTVNGGGGTFVVEDGGNFQLQGDETYTSPTSLDSGSTVTYDATSGVRSIADLNYHHLAINGSGGTFTLGGAESLNGDLTVTAGTLDANDQTMVINENTTINGGNVKTGSNTFTFGDASGDTVTISSGNLMVESDDTTTDIVINAGTWTNSGGVIMYIGSGINTSLLSAMSPYYDLTVDAVSSSNYALDGAIEVDNDITFEHGAIDVGDGLNYQITVGGNWVFNSGTFKRRLGTVVFNDAAKTSTISGSTTFTNLTCATANKAITFTAGTTQTVAGTLTLTGSSENLITLRSSSDGSQWGLTANGSTGADYVDVKDSDASGGNEITVTNSTDSGNNDNWGFNVAPTAPTTLYANDTTTTAQSGDANPGNLTDLTPALSAIYNDTDVGDIANKYQVEVDTQADFAGTDMWLTSGSGTSITNITAGNRSTDIEYAGAGLTCGTTYYWRIKFWDDDGDEGSWSLAANFEINCTPTTSADSGSVSEDNTYNGDLSHTDGDSDSVTYSVVSDVSNGTLNITNINTGVFTYESDANYNGSDSFTYKVNDGTEDSNTSTFTITINAVNDTPILTATADQNVTEDDTVEITLSGSDVDSGDTLTYQTTETGDSSDACSLSNATSSSITIELDNKDSNYNCTFESTVNDGTIDSTTDEFVVYVTADNDAPSITSSIESSVELDEGDTLLIPITASDPDTSVTTLSVSDIGGNFTTVSDHFTDYGDNTGSFSWTTTNDDAGEYEISLNVADDENTVTQNVDITINDVEEESENNAPTFSGALDNVSFYAGVTTSTVFDLDDYFTDEDAGDSLTYTVSGDDDVVVNIVDGEVSFTADSSFSGTEAIYFIATDEAEATATSNAIIVTVSEPTENKVDYVIGTNKGRGKVTVVYDDGTSKEWTAFRKGGAIPRLGNKGSKSYIFVVKKKSGSTIHVYTLNGRLKKKKRLSPKLHWRKLATGNLDDNKNSEEIVVATTRGGKPSKKKTKKKYTIYFKVFSYKTNTNKLELVKRARYRYVRKDYRLEIRKKTVYVIINGTGKIVKKWKPFD